MITERRAAKVNSGQGEANIDFIHLSYTSLLL